MSQPDWMQKENERATKQTAKGKTANDAAPRLVRQKKAPVRKQKALYIQERHSEAFEDLVHAQKKAKGKKAPELAEEALELLFQKYGVKL